MLEDTTNVAGNNNTDTGTDATQDTQDVNADSILKQEAEAKDDTANATGEPDAKPADGEKEAKADDAKKTEAEEKEGAPDKYEPFKVKDGFTITDTANDALTSLGKELGLTQPQVQGLADKFMEVSESQALAARQASDTAVKAQLNKWVEEAKQDPDFGGTEYVANTNIANKALNTYFSKEAIEMIVGSGLGHNKEILKGFLNIGKRISEDSMVQADSSTVKNVGGTKDMFKDLSPT
jgi:hypothetical protein